MGSRDALESILVEEAKKAGPYAHGPNLMRRMARDEVEMDKYIEWLESQPVEMLQKTYWIMIAGWNGRREGLANVTTLFRDAIGYVSSNGPRSVESVTPPAPKRLNSAEGLEHMAAQKACAHTETTKTDTGKYCNACGKRWRKKKKHA